MVDSVKRKSLLNLIACRIRSKSLTRRIAYSSLFDCFFYPTQRLDAYAHHPKGFTFGQKKRAEYSRKRFFFKNFFPWRALSVHLK